MIRVMPALQVPYAPQRQTTNENHLLNILWVKSWLLLLMLFHKLLWSISKHWCAPCFGATWGLGPWSYPVSLPLQRISISSLTLSIIYNLSTFKIKSLISLSSLSLTEKAMAHHSSTLAWKIPWMEEPGRLQSMGSLGVGHDWGTSLSLFTFLHWRRKWQPTPVFLPGESQGRGSLVGCSLWGHTESDMTEVT